MATVTGAPSDQASDTSTDGRRASIAVVDDDSGFAGYLRTFLALRGYEARSYTRGDEIVAAIRQGEPPDIVLLDVAMPGMDGLQTLKALKAARPELQVIMLSGREQAQIIVEAVRLGAADYVVKPGRPRRPRRDRARCGDQAGDRAQPAGQRADRPPPAAERRSERGVHRLGRQPRDAPGRAHHRAGRRQRRHGADSRRERRRQGAGRARDPPALDAQAASRS